VNPPRLTASPKMSSTSFRTTSLLPAATTHSARPAVTLPHVALAPQRLAGPAAPARATGSTRTRGRLRTQPR
jgi:hypothetical protein